MDGPLEIVTVIFRVPWYLIITPIWATNLITQ